MRWQFVILILAAACLTLNSPVLATNRLVPITAADANVTNLVSWWEFNEGSGATAYDSVGGNHGTIHGATWTTDYTGIALDFDGDDYVEVSDDPSLRFTQYDSFSISSWAKPVRGYIVCKMRASAQFRYFGYYIGYTTDNKYYFTAEKSRLGYVSVYTGEIPQGVWSHVTAVYDNRDMKIYLDGELEGTGAFTHDTRSTAPDKDLVIGARSVDSLIDNHFIGIIDDVRIYDRALSAEEIRQVYEDVCPNCPPFIWISPKELSFFAYEGGTNPASQTLSIYNSGNGVLNWEIAEDCEWLSVVPISGCSTREGNDVNIMVDITGLGDGSYDCELTINPEGVLNSPQMATVTLRVEDGVLEVPSEYPTIQAAIDAANDLDTVMVAPGTYTGTGNKNLDFGGKAITVRSIDPEDPCVVADTVIDCESSGRGFYFHSGEEANSVLAGFTIKRGSVGGNPAKGGGILCSGASPTIENCIITSNQAYGHHGTSDSVHGKHSYGGGLCISGGNPVIIGCTISNNSAIGGNGRNAYCSPMEPPEHWNCAGSGGYGYGGGVYCSSSSPAIIEDCVISNNTSRGGTGGPGMEQYQNGGGGSGYGGGIYSTNLAITKCSVKDNRALGGPGGTNDCPFVWCGGGGAGWGGGIYGSGIISDNIITGNTAQGGGPPGGDSGRVFGGGMYCLNGSLVINCLITNNWGSADYAVYGGGIHGMGVSISNCTICYNWAEADPTVRFGGVYGSTITNCILWGNGDDIAGCSATYSCIEDGDAGEGNINADPYFVSGPKGDYYLSQIAAGQAVDSPCVDAGSDTAANLGMNIFTTRTDEVGDTGIVDMGYHYHPPVIIEYGHPDIDGDGDVDFVDYAWLSMGLFYETSKQIPRGSVVVDGDLSDWPGSVEWIELDKVYWGSPNDVSEARFALQWDANTNKVYAAVVINDTDHVFLDEYVYWNASDRIEVYSQGDAEDGAGWNRIYDVAQQYYVAPDTNDGNWATWAEGETLGGDAGLEYAVDVNGAQIIYEVGVRQFDNYGVFSGAETVVTELHAGHVVGFDIVACTRWDTTNFGMLSENLMMGKYNDASKFGKYILVDKIFSADMDGNGANNYADLGILFESWLLGK